MKLMHGIVNLCWGFARVLHISNNSFCRKLMKTCIIALIVVVANIMACFASDPGGMPGLVKATFKGSSFDSTSDVMANAQECVKKAADHITVSDCNNGAIAEALEYVMNIL